MKIHSDEFGAHIRLTRPEKAHLRMFPQGLEPRAGPRREALKQLVARSFASPKEAAEEFIAFHDVSLDASHWFSLNNVDEQRAAMLLCQLHPNRTMLDQAKGHTNDATSGDDFMKLLQRFEDLAHIEPRQHRSLRHWLQFAQDKKLRYHPWIDKYVEAAGLAVVDASVQPVDAAPTPDRGRRVKRQALIAHNVRRWPTIERDLKDAAKNGLANDAKDAAEVGWWWEGSALAWARARAKVQDAGTHGFPGTIHRMKA